MHDLSDEYFIQKKKEIWMSMYLYLQVVMNTTTTNEPRHKIFNNVVCATNKGSDQPAHTHNKGSDQPAHTRSLIRAFAGRMNIL